MELVGIWKEGSVAAAGALDFYRFYDDGVFKFTVSQMCYGLVEKTHAGKWFIFDGYIILG